MPEESTLQVKLRMQAGALRLKVDFTAEAAWTVLFGPSGSGKTTVLRAIAGLARPQQGRVALRSAEREDVLLDISAKRWESAHRRPIRYAAQTPALFPRATVRQNIRYGMQWSSRPEDEREVAEEVMGLLRVASLAGRRPEELSGGERQRVSVARAVAAAVAYAGVERPWLLLDEPFTGLDGALRDVLAVDLASWLAKRELKVLSVSHDVAECFLLGADVVRMAEGEVVEQGAARRVLAGERARLLARLDLEY